ncbi:MAG: D-alanyl-D-alanine carboxypeptidase, partial [Pseudomonadota bacterium]
MVSRRGFLGGVTASLASGAWANAPETSPFPVPRPAGLAARALPGPEALIAAAGLGGRVSAAVADARTGTILEMHDGLLGLPPASVAKAVTCAYGLERLGPGFRFVTRVVADGPIRNGRLDGDLWIVGGGDPMFGTDDLAALVRALAEAGLREVTGTLRLATGLLPHVREIDPDQPVEVGYNPSIGALNLNFNRVHFEWVRESGGYTVRMDARSENVRPPVTRMRVEIVEREAPVYTFREAGGREVWTVARGALGNGGARWLPVRDPALYAAEVFQVLARSRGIVLDGPRQGGAPSAGATVLAEHTSAPLRDILRSMMRFSTNITAECIGLMSTRAGGTNP